MFLSSLISLNSEANNQNSQVSRGLTQLIHQICSFLVQINTAIHDCVLPTGIMTQLGTCPSCYFLPHMSLYHHYNYCPLC